MSKKVTLIIVGIILVIGIIVGTVVRPPHELAPIGDFSIALADIKREEHTTSLYFAVTKVRDTDAGSQSLEVILVDPHEREYTGRLSIDLNLGEEDSDFALNVLPKGFTYVEVVEIQIPKIAPIQTIRVGEEEKAFERVKLGQPLFLENFGRLAVAKGQSVPVGRWLSFAMNEIGGADNHVAAQVTVENKDFVDHRARVRIAAQHEDGTISWGEHTSISVSGLSEASEFVQSPLSLWKGEEIPELRILLLMYTDKATNERALKAHTLAPGDMPLVELKWSFETKGPVHSSPAIGTDGTIYIGSVYHRPGMVGPGRLYAISPDGSLKWSFRTGGDVYSSPAIAADGTIYVGGGVGRRGINPNVYAINPDGSLKWSFTAGRGIIGGRLAIHSSPAIAPDGTIYVGSIVSRLYALNPDGSLKWSFRTQRVVDSSPAIAPDGTIYVGAGRRLYAINPDGTRKWSFDTGGRVDSSPAIAANGTIYVGSRDGRLYALNPDGSLKWSFWVGEDIDSSPAIAADGTIYVGISKALLGAFPNIRHVGRLLAINPDGSRKWSFETGGGVHSSPVIAADGTIYVGSRDGRLYALNPDGSLKWSFWTGDSVSSSPVITPDGTIYVGSRDGRLYAFREDNGGLADSPWPMFGQNPQRTGRQLGN